MSSVAAVLPGFVGGLDGDAGGFGIIPDTDGHSVWNFLQKQQGLPNATDCNGVAVTAPGATYIIDKVDLSTKSRTAAWVYSYNSPLFAFASTPIAWVDSVGHLYVLDHSGVLYKVNPSASFAQIGSVLQNSNSAAANFFNTNFGAYVVDWALWSTGGNDYVAILNYPADLSSGGGPQLIVINLTAMTVVGNWWHNDTNIQSQFLFIDANNNLWIGLREDSGVSPTGDLTLHRWAVSDGTTTQPTNSLGLVDPFLNISFTQVVANSIFSPSGYTTNGGQSPSLYGRYVESSDSVLLGTIPGGASGPNFSFGGDLAIVSLSTFTASATKADDGTFFGGQSYQDVNASIFRQSKLLGFSGTLPIVIAGFTAAGARQMGGVVRILNNSLAQITSYDLTQSASAYDPLTAASLFWSFYQSASNGVGDLVVGSSNNLYKVITANPIAAPPGTDYLLVNSGDVLAVGLTYRGLWDSTVIYNVGDVVGRADFPPGASRFRLFTAERTHSNVDPFNAGSDTWIPAFIESSTYWPAGPNNETYPPLGNILYYQNPDTFVYSYNFIGGPLYYLQNVAPVVVAAPPGGDHYTPSIATPAGTVQNVPLDNSPNQIWNISVDIGGKSVPLTVALRYNEIAQYWVMTIYDGNGNLLLDSIPFVTGEGVAQNLLAQFAYMKIGSATLFNVSGASA